MKPLLRSLLAALAIAGLCLNATAPARSAPDEEAPEKKAKTADPFATVFTFPRSITLSEEQQQKLDDLKNEYTPKLADLEKTRDEILTPERLKTQKKAIAKAEADGNTGIRAKKAVQAALKLTDAEKEQLADAKVAQAKLMAEIKQKKAELLTDEQRKALKVKTQKTTTSEPA